MKIYNQFISEINIQNVLAPTCAGSMMAERRRAMLEGKINTEIMLDPPKSSDDPCSEDLSHLTNLWGNNPLVWKALHIKEGTLENWQFCKEDLNKKYIYSVESVVPYHFYLATKGYRSLFYSGDHDLKVPFTRTMEWIRSLNFSVIQGWRSWHFGGQVAGYTVLFSNNLTFATVLGGSHTPPTNKPTQSFSMFERWMSHELL
ncbi:Serine carboxypeptidase-like 17 [Platanthera zijinensis]|uniref:Serine carboxypeptidase-like 17 n=1 Tax=Platanthera zijinensis TaxID=2320716 RepID=A0AAP0BCW0_9ASPA